jgi:midasin (ATPase involved in ribosome maturation)
MNNLELQKKAENFIKITEKELLIAGLKLPRNTDKSFAHLVPPIEEFNHYCMDQRTAETVEHIAQSVLLREPCLLEGETSVSKTSAIQYMAMLLNQPLIRLNLNGQTDTGELIGKFIPQAELNQLPIPIEQLLSHRNSLSKSSQSILKTAEQENRHLDSLEIQQLIKNEGLPQKTWNWQNGLIVQAMIHGWWIVLDELLKL